METEKKTSKKTPSRGATMLEKEISAIADWLEYLGNSNLAVGVREGKYKDPAVASRVASMLRIRKLEIDLDEAKKQHMALSGSDESDDDPVTVVGTGNVSRMTLNVIPANRKR